ncbi:SIMPL domain-containing protein [Colwellia piezophila]|uniref:SIMPL domain-containing protein n=1 Tax=Colwellia piezophila TaxID=211668 RepID=UPI00036144FF|nr:SIMPL domain-containing protein [Colwellia piezophila]
MRLLSVYLFFIYLLFIPIQADAFSDLGIEVSGQGSVEVVADQFSLTLTITERGRVPSKLQALVDKKSNAVVNSAKSMAINDSNITSARVNLRIVTEKPSIKVQGVEYHKAKQGSIYVDGQSIYQATNDHAKQRPLFELSRQITVHFNKVSDYDRFLTDIIKINVSHISPLSMSVKERDEYYQQALLLAISHAKEKAQHMAKQAGATIDKLKFLKEVSSNHYRPMYSEARVSGASQRTHVSLIGSQTITARVLVVFSLKE